MHTFQQCIHIQKFVGVRAVWTTRTRVVKKSHHNMHQQVIMPNTEIVCVAGWWCIRGNPEVIGASTQVMYL